MPMTTETAVLSGSRDERWVYRLLDLDGEYLRDLDGVESGTLSYSNAKTIKSGGKITYRGLGENWVRLLVQPVYTATSAAGTIEWPMGVFIPETPGVQYDDGERTEEIELYDTLKYLDDYVFAETLSAAAGSNLVDVARQVVDAAVPGARVLADETDLVLSTGRVWEAGTTALQAVNDLLDSANYFSLWVDGHGRYRMEHYTAPQSRSVVWDFRDDYNGIYEPAFTREQDLFNVPNRMVVIAQGDQDSPPLVGVALNEDPDDPASFQSRGRWVTRVDTGVDADSQQQIDERAARRLVELSNPMAALTISHAIVPLQLNDAVTFRRGPADIDTKAVVQSYDVNTDVGGLVTTRLREV